MMGEKRASDAKHQSLPLFWVEVCIIKTHNIRVEWFHIDVSDGTAGERPNFGFVLECSSDLQNKRKEPPILTVASVWSVLF